MWKSLIILLSALALLCTIRCISAVTVDYDSTAMIIGGERKLIFSGAIHYPRSTAQMWPDLIQKAKDGGLNAVETYIFWNAHEPRYRQYKFDGNLDFIKFFKLIQEAGLYAILRIGPYVCAEWNYGGVPVWLHNIDGCEFRTDNEIFKNEMQIFTTKIVDMCKQANLFAPQGGPIILAQIENEYGNWEVMDKYGEAGKAYLKWCAQMAVAQNIGVPWIMCQQDNAPQPMINTFNGFYVDEKKKPNDPKSPKMFTENWTGWYTKWGDRIPHRTAEDLAFSVARFYQFGGVLVNYYMYHGGTNFGRTSGLYFLTSYDYDAPLDEYGNLNQPKWGHLKELHAAIKLGEKLLTSGTPATTKDYGNGVQLTTYSDNMTGERFCFLSNVNETQDASIDLQQDGKYIVPAWSVSVLGGCNKEIYNTAKVRTQTTIMVKKQIDDEDEIENPTQLSWMWTFEAMKDTLQGKGKFSARQLLEQKRASFDHSDYLWYMTSFDNNGSMSSENLTLHVSTSGQVLHAYVNGKLIGYQQGYVFEYKSPISLVPGRNNITLLSVTVGLQNYGAFFDKGPEGVTGPVKLTDNDKINIDLSSNTWNYKVGLNGEVKRLHDPYSVHAREWKALEESNELPVNRPMVWYKTTFRAPPGTEPVVVDLLGMGKGHAWVNGNSIGRFWPSEIADKNGCDVECDYRGKYVQDSTKCLTNCGIPSQRWYHIPRSFLTPENNILILFEENGGDPSQVSFQTVTLGSICAKANEGDTLELSCQSGKIISEIEFASFGDPKGTCGRILQQGSCHAAKSLSVAEQACVGKESCSISVSTATFGSIDCGFITKRLAVQALCEDEIVCILQWSVEFRQSSLVRQEGTSDRIPQSGLELTVDPSENQAYGDFAIAKSALWV
ncbi:hypothetical protein COLO4_16849 [Corchorus olitorius]|uniref:Beta-galactosidase n=1 Tax=Corchorus olitorius TaxID=93759 RepID=A0A1R3JFM3_9ROSI|nr:hypothetical protein COLO4_16849 [Corchorus olitorius]